MMSAEIAYNPEDILDLKRLTMILRRHWLLIVVPASTLLLLSVIYIGVTPRQYTAQAKLLLDKSMTSAVSDISSKRMGFEDPAIESEVEVLKSRRVIDSVIDTLSLKGYFPAPARGGLSREEIANDLERRLRVSRVEETYILSVRYTSDDPEKAAEIANAFAQAYIDDQLDALSETTERTTFWLQGKVADLRTQMAGAQQALIEYREAYNARAQSGKGKDEDAEDSHHEIGLIEMRNLEQEAQTYRDLYDAFLEKMETINTQQTFPVTETRIITSATPPLGPSHPNPPLIIGAALIFGVSMGIVLAIIWDNFDRSLRRAGQVRNLIGIPFLGFVPKIKTKIKGRKGGRSLAFSSRTFGDAPFHLASQSVDIPLSPTAETVRTLKNEAERKGARVIGIVSTSNTEGKRTIAENLAIYIAASGTKTLLIDGNIREETSETGLCGLGSVLSGDAALSDAIYRNDNLNLAILPGPGPDAGRTLAALTAERIKDIVTESRKEFGTIVMNLPPLMAAADVYSFSEAADAFAVVARWGRTQPNSLNFHLKQNGICGDRILGLILNEADMKKMEKYYGHRTTA